MSVPTNMVQIDSHAASTLRYIRASMEAAASLAIPGSAGLALGAIGLSAMLVSSVPQLRDFWLPIWLIAATVGGVTGGILMLRPASLERLTLPGTPARKFALCLLPSLFGGAVLTAVLWSSNNLHAIPGMWLLLYGCALISASIATTSKIAVMGGLFATLGLIAFVLPDELQVLMLGIGFGALHVLFGFLIGRSSHVSHFQAQE